VFSVVQSPKTFPNPFIHDFRAKENLCDQTATELAHRHRKHLSTQANQPCHFREVYISFKSEISFRVSSKKPRHFHNFLKFPHSTFPLSASRSTSPCTLDFPRLTKISRVPAEILSANF
jgi:hypothetical protein